MDSKIQIYLKNQNAPLSINNYTFFEYRNRLFAVGLNRVRTSYHVYDIQSGCLVRGGWRKGKEDTLIATKNILDCRLEQNAGYFDDMGQKNDIVAVKKYLYQNNIQID